MLRSMMEKMKHRGPDDTGIFTHKAIGLGFVRLSILDLTNAGHQPMSDDSGRYMIVLNGEVYNYIELREELKNLGFVFRSQTDTEVVLKAYIQWGADCLDKFNGMFAFAIYDSEREEVFGARDRYGIKPFYYCLTDELFIFASEIPPILDTGGITPTPDNQVIFDYLVFNRTDQTENTFFAGIKKLQHGHSFLIKNGALKIKKWYDLRERVKRAAPFKDAEEYRELLSSAVGLRLRSDVPVGVCLSGGLDSSSITSILLKDYRKDELNTFSAVYRKGEVGDESEFINEYIPFVKNMHLVYPTATDVLKDLSDFVKIHAEPIPGLSPYAQYKVMQSAKGNVVVTLDGQGADEELAGYPYFYGFYFKDLLRSFQLKLLFKELSSYWKIHHSAFGYKAFLFFLLPKSIRTKVRANEYGYIDEKFVNDYSQTNSIAGNLYGSNSLQDALLDHFEYKLEHLLKWDDRNSMANSIESRVPFLDYRLVERTLASSSSKKIKDGITKNILRKAMKGTLPEKIRNRMDKMGFETPQDAWFRTPEFQKIVNEIINSPELADRSFFRVERIKLLYEKHLKNEINVARELWKVIHLELWYRKYIDIENKRVK